MIEECLDLEHYPLNRPDTVAGRVLMARCRESLRRLGMFSLEGLVRQDSLARAVPLLSEAMHHSGYTHRRRHNIYFEPNLPDMPAGHPALAQVETVNHTLCADQLSDGLLVPLFEWPPLVAFLAAVMDKERLLSHG